MEEPDQQYSVDGAKYDFFLNWAFFHGSGYLADLDPESGENVQSGQSDPYPKYCRNDGIRFLIKLSSVANPDSVGSGQGCGSAFILWGSGSSSFF